VAVAGGAWANNRGRAPRVAIVHYWLVTMRGGERVVERLLHLFPDADIFTHVYVPDAVSQAIRARPVRTSFIQRLPNARRWYQRYLPLMPMALEELDLSGYDLVISSESGPAKGVIAAPDALHLCYCHSPARYLWDHYHEYRASFGRLTRWMAPPLFHYLRNWDAVSAGRIDRIVANSRFIADRVGRAWNRAADVVHPPVAVDLFRPVAVPEGPYLWVGQMTPYKRGMIAVEAFTRMGLPLLMVGTGESRRSMERAAGPNIRFVDRMSFAELQHAYANCRAFIFTPEEDFGIVPVEANASGRPVIAYGRGGVRDTMVDGETGLFYHENSADALIDAVERFEAWQAHFDPARAVANARRFAPEHFDAGILAAIAKGKRDATAF